MFIFVKHLVHTVRLQRVHRWPQGPKIPNLNRKKDTEFSTSKAGKTQYTTTGIYLVLRQRKHTFRLSTSCRTRPSVGKASTSAFVSTVRICTISARVNDSLQYLECHISSLIVLCDSHLSSKEMESCHPSVLVSSSWSALATSGSIGNVSDSVLLQDCREPGRDCGTE